MRHDEHPGLGDPGGLQAGAASGGPGLHHDGEIDTGGERYLVCSRLPLLCSR